MLPHRPPPILIQTPLIPVLYAQTATREVPQHFPHIDAWAVPAHKVLSRRGAFRSADLKDLLGLSNRQKLILSTAGPDDYMEMLWEKGDRLDYAAHGIDYWFPAHFSVYDNDSKFLQFFNARRQQMHARMVKSAFVWFRLGEHIPVEWLGPITQSPSVVISCQQMYNAFNRRLLRQEIQLADKLFPVDARFFLLGSGYGASIRPDRIVHEISSAWIMRALKGHDMRRRPNVRLSRSALLRANLRALYRDVEVRRRATRERQSIRAAR